MCSGGSWSRSQMQSNRITTERVVAGVESENVRMTRKTITNAKAAATAIAAEHRKCKIARQRPPSWSVRSVRWFCLVLYCSTLLTVHSALAVARANNTSGNKITSSSAATSAGGGTLRRQQPERLSIAQYSQPLGASGSGGANDGHDDSFRPIIPADLTPEDISRNVFTPEGQYRVFDSVESDLRATTTMRRKDSAEQAMHVMGADNTSGQAAATASNTSAAGAGFLNEIPHTNPDKELEDLLSEYLQNFFGRGEYEPRPDLVIALQKNHTAGAAAANIEKGTTTTKGEENLRRRVRDAATAVAATVETPPAGQLSLSVPRAVQTGRVFFFAGLKKVLWPIFMGLQILKSLLFALLLPSLIGSVGKLLGKGIISGSAPLFIRPLDAPQDVDFKDNTFNFDDDNKFPTADIEPTKDEGYAYNQAEASQTHNQYAYNAAAINQEALSRYGMNEQQKMQDSYLSALQSLSSASFKNSNSISGSSSAAGLGALAGGGGGGGGGGGTAGGFNAPARNKPASPANMETFQTFQKVPASSLLLSNYDPFYSPLLSRLDSVFAQLKLNSESEECREKLICLMYSNPAKYAPYSNLVSAQLSRELNELRKPTSDNPDILRFFKYMRAAKDGQDGVDCEKTFDGCQEFKDFENPAMLSTYNDINKLVQARKLTK